MAVWENKETVTLIGLWGEDDIQQGLGGCHRNLPIYITLASQLNAHLGEGSNRTAEECRRKIKRLKIEYYKEKRRRKDSGEGGVGKFKYFESMDQILGKQPMGRRIASSGIHNTCMDEEDSSSGGDDADDEDNQLQLKGYYRSWSPSPSCSSDSVCPSYLSSAAVDSPQSESPAAPSSAKAPEVSTSGKKRKNQRLSGHGKRRRNRNDLKDIISSFIEMEKKLQERFLQNEVKMRTLELEAQEKRRREEEAREVRRRKEYQEFQLEMAKLVSQSQLQMSQMMMMMMQRMNSPHVPQTSAMFLAMSANSSKQAEEQATSSPAANVPNCGANANGREVAPEGGTASEPTHHSTCRNGQAMNSTSSSSTS